MAKKISKIVTTPTTIRLDKITRERLRTIADFSGSAHNTSSLIRTVILRYTQLVEMQKQMGSPLPLARREDVPAMLLDLRL